MYTLDAARSSYPLEEILEQSKGGLKFIRLCPGMSKESRNKAIHLAKSYLDIIGIVLDFNTTAKVDSQVKEIKANIPSASWEPSDIKSIKS